MESPDPGEALWHNARLRAAAWAPELRRIRLILSDAGMFQLEEFPTGLRPASSLNGDGNDSAYRFAWLRDNMHLAHADLVAGRTDAAVRVFNAWLHVFELHLSAHGTPMPGRPFPVKVEGPTGNQVAGSWSHEQNDAIGMFVWFAGLLVQRGLMKPQQRMVDVLRAVASYLAAIDFSTAADSGHWEEERRLNASSIGCVVAGAEEWRRAAAMVGVDPVFSTDFVTRGRQALKAILPWETPSHEERARRTDSALLFLIYPLDVVDRDTADMILRDNAAMLQRPIGVARYVGDSYWAPNYRSAVPEDLRAVDYSSTIEDRNQLSRAGKEAQWTLFDPVLSIAYGRRYRQSQAPNDLRLQHHHLLRSLGAVSSDDSAVPCRLPEAYFLEGNEWVMNDNVPLRWAEAMLELALLEFGQSLA